jgi:hypothetical protein
MSKCPKYGSEKTVDTTWEEENGFAIFFTGHTCMNCAHHWDTSKINRVDKK